MDSPLNIYNSNNNTFNLKHGFLPSTDPLLKLPQAFTQWESVAENLPKLLVSEHLRSTINNLPPFPLEQLTDGAELERAMLLLSYLGHAYVWQAGQEPAQHITQNLAVAWYELSQQLHRPPILSYASYALYNWRRINPDGAIALGNIALAQNFLGGIDEEWFILVHVDIEHKAIPALQAILPAQQAIINQDAASLLSHLQSVHHSLTMMIKTLERMPEHCDPYIYYHRVRPYIHGWEANPALPNGMLYTGVAAYHNQAVTFKGETGAQSSIIPALDAFLNIEHAENSLKQHLLEMRQYMPDSHRLFLDSVERGPSIRHFIQQHATQPADLKAWYNKIIEAVHRFRQLHIHYAAQYIQKQNLTNPANPTDIGTGGTPFMEYLRKHKDETLDYRLE